MPTVVNSSVKQFQMCNVGSQEIITEGHMPGMKGATATIVGAYDTNVYAVSYTPTTGGEPVKNHKSVIQQDLKDAGEHTNIFPKQILHIS